MHIQRFLARALVFGLMIALWPSACGDDDSSDQPGSDSGSDVSDISWDGSLDHSLDGLYETVTYQKKQPCTATFTDRPITQRYFRLEAMVVQGQPFLARYECSGDTLDTCSETMSFFQSLIWKDGWWFYWLVATMYLEGCNISMTQGTPQITEEGITIELTNRSGVVAGIGEADCDTDLAETTVDFQDLDCSFVELYEFRRIE